MTATQRSFLLIGHRGAAAEAPENTLPSLQRALDCGVDRIEIDVHMTCDGRIVLLHDRTLNRTTSGKGEVRHYTLDRIKQLDAGAWFSPAFAGTRVPTLEEALELVAGKALLMIEVKEHSGYTPGIEAAVADIIRRYHAQDHCLVISLRHRVVRTFHRRFPDIRLGRTWVGRLWFLPLWFDEGLTLRGLRQYPYVDEFNLQWQHIRPADLRCAAKMGKPINAWTTDDAVMAASLAAKGVRGIMTNAPNEFTPR